MQDIQKTRFLAANYNNLQGLRTVPMGLLLLVVVVWANTQRGPASDLTLPLLFTAGMALLAWGIQRYYMTRYGKTESTLQQKKLEIWLGLGGGVVGLAAFVADTALHLPFSCIGLLFAASFLIEYWRTQQIVQGHYLLPFTLVYTFVMLLVSVLPLLGFDGWWLWIGMRAQLLGVLTVAGTLIAVTGLLGHWFFVRQFPRAEE